MSTLLKVVGAIVLIGIAAVVMLVFAVTQVARHTRVVESGTDANKTVKIETPLGTMQIHAKEDLDPSTIGIPIYPGAQKSSDKSGAANFALDAGDFHKDLIVKGANFITPDPPAKVRDFYRARFPDWKQKWNDERFHLEATADGRLRSVEIDPRDGGTRIAIAVLGPAESN